MTVFLAPDFDQHELVAYNYDESLGLKVIIAIHNTNRGPALGGCRLWHYQNEEEATRDVLRLSRGMTYKAALANLNLGGGKAVILADEKQTKTPEMFRAVGRLVERFNGRYITAEDVGTSPQDMAEIYKETKHVVGLDASGMKGGSGDPSILTAYGVYHALKGCAQYRYGSDSLSGVKIAIQGLGHVGMLLIDHLHKEGADLIVSDINQANVQEMIEKYNVRSVAPEEIYSAECDIFSPCALGGVINDDTITKFKCQIIAGASNNQLLTRAHADMLKNRGILYAPDYLINAGGLINVSYEGPKYDRAVVMKHVEGIRDTLIEILKTAEEQNISTSAASDQIAEQRFKKN